MTVLAPPAPDTAAPTARRGSLLRAEVRRFRARRFIKVVLALALVLYAVVIGISAATEFGRTTPERLAAAEREVQRVVAEQEMFRQQCLEDPNRPPGIPEDQVCGPPSTDAGFRAQDFLDKQPFVLSEQLPGGSLALSAATSALAFLIGATYVGAEWSTRSIVALLFWEPRRLRVIATKLAVLAAAAAALSVAAQALWWGTAIVLSRTLGRTGDTGDGFYGDLVAQQGRALVLVVLMGLLGFSLANLVRNTGAALGVGFVYFAIVETAVRNIRPRWQEWLLTDNALALVQQGGNRLFLFGEGFVDERGQYVDTGREIVLSNLHGGLVLGGVTAVLVAAGVLLFQKRDLH